MLSTWSKNKNKKFVSLEQVTNKSYTEKEIMDTLIARNKTVYLPKGNEYLTLTTLIHEFGHVWGLCDQYPLDGNTTNCDPNHSTLSPRGHIILEEDAIMSSASWHNPLWLHKDDIEGIIDLGSRQDMADTGWAAPSIRVDGVTEILPKSFEFGQISEITLEPKLLSVSLALHTSTEGKVLIQVKGENSTRWIDYASAIIGDKIKTRSFAESKPNF